MLVWIGGLLCGSLCFSCAASGRAGRRNSMYGQGLVTCLNKSDIPRLEEAIATPLEALSTPTAGLFPEFEQLEAFAGNQLEADFHTILNRQARLS